jgi:hypothetical protein
VSDRPVAEVAGVIVAILLVVLALPTLVWVIVRWLPSKEDTQPVRPGGPRHRWWQP